MIHCSNYDVYNNHIIDMDFLNTVEVLNNIDNLK